MPTGFAAAVSTALLDAIGNAANYTAPTAFWMKLHIGDPGAAGTSNPATETTRQQVSFGAASGGAISNDADIAWTGLATGDPDDYTHWSAWTDVSAGSFICSGTITANAVSDGDNFTIPAGDLDLSLSTAS